MITDDLSKTDEVKMILFINACVRKDSRTKKLADIILAGKNGPIEEVRPIDLKMPIVDEKYLLLRDALISDGHFDSPFFTLARQFASADEIVIAAPYWDLSFPAALKQYIELINVPGITFFYTDRGPQGLCKATRLTYVTTAGGDYTPDDYGFGYIQTLANSFYGIKDVNLIKVTGLDVDGADTNAIMASAINAIK